VSTGKAAFPLPRLRHSLPLQEGEIELSSVSLNLLENLFDAAGLDVAKSATPDRTGDPAGPRGHCFTPLGKGGLQLRESPMGVDIGCVLGEHRADQAVQRIAPARMGGPPIGCVQLSQDKRQPRTRRGGGQATG
jgi:hypothetical protein